jgi:transketolase
MTWEAFQTMSHYKIDNVKIYVDVNGHQCDGSTDEVMGLLDIQKKAEAFGAHVITLDGHDISALLATKNIIHTGKPLLVLCMTSPFRGLPEFQKNKPKFHYLRFKDQAEKIIYQEALKRL